MVTAKSIAESGWATMMVGLCRERLTSMGRGAYTPPRGGSANPMTAVSVRTDLINAFGHRGRDAARFLHVSQRSGRHQLQ